MLSWHATSRDNFEGSIGSRKGDRRELSICKVYFICVILAGYIAWAAVKNEKIKKILLVLTSIIAVPLFCALTICLLYYSYRYGYWAFYRCIRKQRKAMDRNSKDLKNTLLEFNEQIPSIDELELIEKTNRQYLHNTQRQINEIMETETELMLTGSSVERYSIPFTKLQETSTRHNSCISMVTMCCDETLQRQELIWLTNLRHAILSDCDCMLSPSNDMVSFSKEGQKYQALVKLFPYYIITDGNEELHSKRLKKHLLEGVEKTDITSIPWHLSSDDQLNNYVVLYINGPALTLKLGSSATYESTNMQFYGDITYSLKCPEWPETCDWGHRLNTKWPNPEEIMLIKSHGCHFVPKSHHDDLEGLTWRISFSKAEVELSKLVPNVARMCLVGVKIITKDYLAVVCKKLKSYHLKCVFLHTLETTDPSIWREDNLVFCFEHLLKSLRTCFENEMAPYFWLSSNNLFDDFTKKDFQNLLKQLTIVERNPSEFIEPLFLNKRRIEYEQIENMNDINIVIQ